MDPHTYSELRNFVVALGLTQPRILALMIALPIFARQIMPGLLRFGVAAGLGLVAAPMLLPEIGRLPDGLGLAMLLIKEAAIGFLIGFLIAIPFWSFEAVGFLIDNQRGASIAATLNPLTGNDSSPLGLLFNQAFIVFVLASGAFLLVLGLLYESFRIWPVTTWTPVLDRSVASAWLAQLDRLVKVAALLAAPAIVAMFLAEVGLALVSRFAPQLQVFFLAMPVKSAVALLVLVLYMATLFDYARREFDLHLDSILPFLARTVAPAN
jgi:type III secretion protein T